MGEIVLWEHKFVDSDKVVLTHYGMPRRSGRYPWGSGDNPYQRTLGFRADVDAMVNDWIKTFGEERITTEAQRLRAVKRAYADIAKGMGMSVAEFRWYLNEDLESSGKSVKEIASAMGMSVSEYRSWKTTDGAVQRTLDVAEANALYNKGWSKTAIAEKMGYSEGTVRNLLQPGYDAKAKRTMSIVNAIKEAVDEKTYVDVGRDINLYLGVSDTEFRACVRYLEDEGYHVYYDQAEQFGTGKDTNFKVLAAPDKTWKEFKDAFAEDPGIVKSIGLYSDDRGETISEVTPPVEVDRSRIFVRYGDEGGSDKDGVIEIRPGVADLDMGENRYMQVRVAVEGGKYMKGMAIRGMEVPEGYDVVYNTNKKSGSPDEKVFKPMKDDPENPFGASIKFQNEWTDASGQKHTGPLNVVNEEDKWSEWKKSLPSQFLSKQKDQLAKEQLGLALKSKQDEFDEIMKLDNPTVRAKLLQEFADGCDSDANHLKGAAMPRQATQVILPLTTLKDSEIYAPNFRDGEKVVCIRYPHGGTFEIPELTVNNKNEEGKFIIGTTRAAVGFNAKVAERLSGADFDGDSVIVIPNNDGKIKTSKPLSLLDGFDPKASFPLPENDPQRTKDPKKREQVKNGEMGKVSNLITDMTLKGADQDEIARAVAHSMVVIDSVKHDLDYKASYKYYGIQELQDKYQGKEDPSKPGGGASTIVSRAKSPIRIPERKELTSTRDMTPEEKAAWDRGERVYRETGRTYVNKAGKVVAATTEVKRMEAAKDARELSSGTTMEEIYVNHANGLKELGNKARAALRTTPKLEQSASAKKTYAAEVESLKNKLNVAAMNAPRERQAVLVSNSRVKKQQRDNPGMTRDQVKKYKNKALSTARARLGSNKKGVQVQITPREWEAIQAGAVSHNLLWRILNNTDMDKVRQYATPRASQGLSSSQITRIQSMYARGMTQADIADVMGISTSAVMNAVKS